MSLDQNPLDPKISARNFGVAFEVCQGAPSCCRSPFPTPYLLFNVGMTSMASVARYLAPSMAPSTQMKGRAMPSLQTSPKFIGGELGLGAVPDRGVDVLGVLDQVPCVPAVVGHVDGPVLLV